MHNVWRTLFSAPRRAAFDLLWLGILALVVCIVGFSSDVPGRVYRFFVASGAGNGEVGFVLGVLTIALAIFALRRWLDMARAEQEFRGLFEDAPIGVFRATLEGRFLMANPALAHMLGYDTPQELMASVTQISDQLNVKPETRAAYMFPLQHDGTIRDFENQVCRQDGSTIWVLGNAHATRDADGKIRFIQGSLQDITARKETEQAYRRLVDQSLQGIVISQGGRIAFANRAFADLLGYTVPELLELEVGHEDRLIHPDDRAMMQQRAADRLAGKSVPSHYVFQALHKDGRTRWLETNANIIEYRGQPAILMLMMDVTERKGAQDKMQENVERARLREEVSAALARGGTDLRAVLNNLTRVLIGTMGDGCMVTLLSADRQWNDVAAFAHLKAERHAAMDELSPRVRLPVSHPFFSHVVVQGEPLIISNLQSQHLELSRGPLYTAYLGRYPVTALLIVPVRHGSHILGSVTVTRNHAAMPFTLDDQVLLQELADRAGLAIANAQLVQQLNAELDAHRDAEAKYRTLLFQHGITLDITAQKQESELRERVRELKAIQETTASLEHARRKAENAERAQRAFAKVLGDAAALLNRATDADQILDDILDLVARIVPYDTASIFMSAGAELRLARARGFDKYGLEEWVQTLTFSQEILKFQQFSKRGVPTVIPDTQQFDGWINLPETSWIRSHLAAPIRINNRTVGMLGLDSETPNFYNQEHAARLLIFADLAASALRNAQSLSEAQRRAQQLSLLYDVGLTLNRVLDARTQLDFLFKIAQRALLSDLMAFFRYDLSQDVLLFEFGTGMPAEVEAGMRAYTYSVSQPATLVGWVAQNRLPALVPDVSLDDRWREIADFGKSAVAVPVEHERQLRGVLLAGSHHLNGFTSQDERLLILFANQVAAAMELTRLFEAQAQRRHELEILREASLAFATTSNRETLSTLILQFALRLVAAHDAFLFYHHNDELEFGGMLWAPDSPKKNQHFTPRRDGFTYTVARSGQSIVIDAVNSHPLFANWQWGGAIVGLPLKGGGQVRAVLNIAYKEPHSFTPEELRALGLFADQAAVALENARHVEETERQLRDARLLHRAGSALNRTLSFDAAIEPLADFFIEAVGVKACCIWSLHEAADEIRVLVDRDPSPDTRATPGTRDKLSVRPHLAQVVREQRTLSFRRDTPDLSTLLQADMERYHWQSLLVLPLLAGDQVTGIVELADQDECREFSPQVIRLAESLAHQAASTLVNARLFQETRRRAESLTVLNHIARQVNAVRTLDEMLLIIESETATVLPSDASYIALYDAATEMVDFHRVVDYAVPRAPFRWRLGPSFTRQVITTARALRMDDRQEYPSLQNPAQFYGDGSTLRAWLGVPIRSGEHVLGVISLQSKLRAAFSEADEQLLQTIAGQVAPAIERAQRAP